MGYLLGVDLGTSACKVAAFDADGTVVARAEAGYPLLRPGPGLAEQRPEDWWAAAADGIRRVTEAVGGDIDCVGVDGQSWAAVLVDADGTVLCNTPIWMDTRATEACTQMRDICGADSLFALCGNPVAPSYTLPKLLWYRQALPDAYRQAQYVLQSNAFIVYRLTGRATQDLSQGYGLHCFDVRSGTWNLDVMDALGLRGTLLPPLYPCDAVVGHVHGAAAKATGLRAGTPVVAGGLDAACGSLGAGVFRPGQTQEQGGQAGGISICMDRAVADPRLILSRHVVPDRWLLQGGTVGGGGALRWLRETVCPELSFEMMSALAQQVPPGSEGLVFLPYLSGERSPLWDPQARGVYYGLDYSKGRAHLIRACMEGVAYSVLHNLEVARQAGASVSLLHAMGGSANSAVWTQIKADVTGCTIRVPASDTATTLGAAMLAGVGCGLYRDYDEAVRRTVRIAQTYVPDPERAGAYHAGYETYRALGGIAQGGWPTTGKEAIRKQ